MSRPRVQSESPRPGPRRDHSLTADPDRGRLYLFGGRAAGRPLGDLWEYDPATLTWTELVADGLVPEARLGHAAIYDPADKQLVVALGQAGARFFDDVWAFQPDSRAWARLDDASLERPTPRYGSAAAFDETSRRLLISHGFTDRGRFDDTWTFDIAAASWARVSTAGPTPVKRCLARGGFDASTGRLLMFGGQTDAAPFLGDFWSLDLATGSWSEVAADGLPTARHLYAAVSAADAWHVIGGNTTSGATGEHWVYRPALNMWALADEHPGRVSHDVAILGDHLYGFGGTDGQTEFDDVWQVTGPA